MGIKSTSASNVTDSAQETPLSSLLAAIASRNSTGVAATTTQTSGFAAVLKSMSAPYLAPGTQGQARSTGTQQSATTSTASSAETTQADATPSSSATSQSGTTDTAASTATSQTASKTTVVKAASATTTPAQTGKTKKSQSDASGDEDTAPSTASTSDTSATSTTDASQTVQDSTAWSMAETLMQMVLQGAASVQGQSQTAGADAAQTGTTDDGAFGADAVQAGSVQATGALGEDLLSAAALLQGALQGTSGSLTAQGIADLALPGSSASLVASLSDVAGGLASAVGLPTTTASAGLVSALQGVQAGMASAAAVSSVQSPLDRLVATVADALAGSSAASATTGSTAITATTDTAQQAAFTLQQVAAAVSNVSVTQSAQQGAQTTDGTETGLTLSAGDQNSLASGGATLAALGSAVQEAVGDHQASLSDQSGNGTGEEEQALLADAGVSASTLEQSAAQGASSFSASLGTALGREQGQTAATAQAGTPAATTQEEGQATGLFSLASADSTDTGLSMTVMTADSTPVHVRVEGTDGVTTGVVLQSEDAATAHHLANTRHELVAALDAAGVDVGQLKIDVVSASDTGNNTSNQDTGGSGSAGGAFGGANANAGQGGSQTAGGNAWTSSALTAAQDTGAEASDTGATTPATRAYDGRGVNITA